MLSPEKTFRFLEGVEKVCKFNFSFVYSYFVSVEVIIYQDNAK